MKFPATYDQIREGEADEDGMIEIPDELVKKRRRLYSRWAVRPEVAGDDTGDMSWHGSVPKYAFITALDTDDIAHIRQHLCDPRITAAAFSTENGEYWPLFIRYGKPSYRTGGTWYKIVARHPETGKFVKGSGWL